MKLRPSQIKANPDRFSPDTVVIIRAPLGEWIGNMAFPLVILGMKDSLIRGDILDSDSWNAQGLEGAGQVVTNWARAFVLTAKAGDGRCTVIVQV
jgi:hypothetical protein